ncbi:MAG: ABC transporter ATP-binding protein [Bacillota bacterium]|jgi:iron complex transport system ATP-binding protein|nr:ABC transporter ATP-binding protein [Bacillota bacterium]
MVEKIRLDGVTYAYGKTPVLQELSLGLQPSKFYGVVGPNGAGKSTLLKLMDGYLDPQQGVITLNDRPLQSYSLRELAQEVALIPQHSHYFPFTVEEMVLLGRTPFYTRLGQPSAKDVQLAQEAMQVTEVAHLAGRLVSDLSGGERQRVTLARAFAQHTKVLLLDEPTTHLDLEHQINTCQLLQKRAQEGVTCLAVLHDLNLVANFCDYVFVLGGGSLVKEGPPTDVFTPELIQKVFHVSVPSLLHPVTGRPVIVP